MTTAEAFAELRRRNVAATEALAADDKLNRLWIARLKRDGRCAEKCLNVDCRRNACGFCAAQCGCPEKI